jgi:hypothetical protein
VGEAGKPHAAQWPEAPAYPVMCQPSAEGGAAFSLPYYSTVIKASYWFADLLRERGWDLGIRCAAGRRAPSGPPLAAGGSRSHQASHRLVDPMATDLS